MDTLHAGELNIRGSGRPRDPRCRALRVDAGDHFWDAVDNLVLAHDAHVTVRHQGQRAAAARLIGFEHDGAGLRGGDVGFGHHGVDGVELTRVLGIVIRGDGALEAEREAQRPCQVRRRHSSSRAP